MKSNTARAYAFIDSGALPQDALYDAASALEAISTLMSGHDNLHLIGERDIHGLQVVFAAIGRVMDGAAAALTDQSTPAEPAEGVKTLDPLEKRVDQAFDRFIERLGVEDQARAAKDPLRRRFNEELRKVIPTIERMGSDEPAAHDDADGTREQPLFRRLMELRMPESYTEGRDRPPTRSMTPEDRFELEFWRLLAELKEQEGGGDGTSEE